MSVTRSAAMTERMAAGLHLKGKTALVTGAASGIGWAAAEMMARLGAQVIMTDIDDRQGRARAHRLCDEGFEAAYLHLDVRSVEGVSGVMRNIAEAYGGLDIVFANAGIGEMADSENLAIDDWQRVMDINLTGVFLTVREAIPLLKQKGGGSVIINASILGHVGMAKTAAYAASKGGVVQLTRALALEYAGGGIRVNAVCPGFIRTPMVTEGPAADDLDAIAALHPLGRLGEPEEVAAVVAFLASDLASFMTGASVMVDGGYTAQ